MADRPWTLQVFPTAEYVGRQDHWTSLLVGAGGLGLAALLQVLLLVTTGRTSIVERQVREQTTELQARADALADRHAELAAVFNLSPDGFVAFAPDGRIRFVSPAFQAMTGMDAQALVGRSERDLEAGLRARGASGSDGELALSSCFGEPAGPLAQRRLQLRTPRPVTLQIVGIGSDSASIARILLLRDVTRESEVDRLKSEFIAHAAHELRTPMTSILGFSELLLTRQLDETKRARLLENIHRQARTIVQIINELLDLAHIESQRSLDVDPRPVDLTILVRETAAGLPWVDPAWTLVLDLPDHGVPAVVDAAKLGRVLTNLLSNAVKYSPDGGQIRVALVDAPGRIGIVVQDQGIGMTPEQAARIGERFWRADRTGRQPGAGLGLAIVQELLRLLGGHLAVHSTPGEGSRFTVWLPVPHAAAQGGYPAGPPVAAEATTA